ncbi:hypothetical protein N7507_009380 [Penicillium longicatenatum]|nr:hypothetical protein N7507_009380 [Penicillium longicatenatum]
MSAQCCKEKRNICGAEAGGNGAFHFDLSGPAAHDRIVSAQGPRDGSSVFQAARTDAIVGLSL